jgi:hypothetical protein
MAIRLPFLRSDLERTTWHEVAALVVCETTHPFSVLYVTVYHAQAADDSVCPFWLFRPNVRDSLYSLVINLFR